MRLVHHVVASSCNQQVIALKSCSTTLACCCLHHSLLVNSQQWVVSQQCHNLTMGCDISGTEIGLVNVCYIGAMGTVVSPSQGSWCHLLGHSDPRPALSDGPDLLAVVSVVRFTLLLLQWYLNIHCFSALLVLCMVKHVFKSSDYAALQCTC